MLRWFVRNSWRVERRLHIIKTVAVLFFAWRAAALGDPLGKIALWIAAVVALIFCLMMSFGIAIIIIDAVQRYRRDRRLAAGIAARSAREVAVRSGASGATCAAGAVVADAGDVVDAGTEVEPVR